MKRLSVRFRLPPALPAAAAFVAVFSMAWPGTLGGADDKAPRRNTLAIRVLHSQKSAMVRPRASATRQPLDQPAETEIASADSARAAPPHEPSVLERLGSMISRAGEEEAALFGSAVSPPTAATVEDPREAPAEPPRSGDRTAVYDIAAHAVYLPDGNKLEAHSGLGPRMDDPRSVNVKNRGPTPPNVYDLAMRKPLFHGVRAIRLIPVDEGKMFGRDGILAHSYMHGSAGQSNGCVVFRDYPTFLEAFLRGDVERLVVVDSLEAPIAPAGVMTARVTSPSPVSHFKRKVRHVSRSSARTGQPS
jgi:hypothetical protein